MSDTTPIHQEGIKQKKFKIKKKKQETMSDTTPMSLFKSLVKKVIIIKRMYVQFKDHRKFILSKLEEKKYRGQKKYAIEYMKQYPTKMVKQGDLLHYCDERRNEDTGGKKPNFKDNSRGIEQWRKDILPNCWKEKKINGELYFIYLPELKELVSEEIINNTKDKNKGFSTELIKSKTEDCKYKCELTGLPVSEGHLAADHWIPKESGGKSDPENCVILNKILNEKKNKHNPIDWFCKSLLTNLLTICKKSGMDIDQVKTKLIKFIQEF